MGVLRTVFLAITLFAVSASCDDSITDTEFTGEVEVKFMEQAGQVWSIIFDGNTRLMIRETAVATAAAAEAAYLSGVSTTAQVANGLRNGTFAIDLLTKAGWASSNSLAVAAPAQTAAAAGAGAGAGGVTSVLIAGVQYVVLPVVVAVGVVVAVDRARNGNFIWEEVNAAGGWGVVLGVTADPTAGPAAGQSSVACNSQDRVADCRRAIKNTATQYSSWWLGSTWTCADVFADGSGPVNGNAAWNTALSGCNTLANQCVQMTAKICR